MAKHKSITMRIKTAKRLDTKLEIVDEWVTHRQDDVQAIIDELKQAHRYGDAQAYHSAIDKLIDHKHKTLPAVANIVHHFAELAPADD